MSFVARGLPKEECREFDIYKLFQAVAQVQKVKLWRKQGAAEVTLFDKSSLAVVFEQEWCLNGSILTLEHSTGRLENVTKINSQQPSKSTNKKHDTKICVNGTRKCRDSLNTITKPYTNYKKTASAFWKDIPHSASKMVISVKRKRKRLQWGTYWHKDPLGPKCSQTKPKKSHHKSKIYKKGGDIEGILDWKTKGNIFDVTESTQPQGDQEGKKLVMNNLSDHMISMGMPHLDDQKPGELYKAELPLYVRIHGSTLLIYIIKNSVLDIKSEILRLEKVPKRLQMIMHKGKIIEDPSASDFEPYDTVEVLIRGRGGMQQGSSGHVSPKSTFDEVLHWLKEGVGIDDNILEKYEGLQFLDGKTLFSSDLHTFKNDVEIPIGLARRIWTMRDESFSFGINKLLTYSSQNVSNFVQDLFKERKSESISKLCAAILRKYIDGVALWSYKNVDEFFDDFEELKLQKVIFRKIIVERDHVFQNSPCQVSEEFEASATVPLVSSCENDEKGQVLVSNESENAQVSEQPPCSSETESQIHQTSCSSNKEITNLQSNSKATNEASKLPVQVQEAQIMKSMIDQKQMEYMTMLEKHLHLNSCQPNDSYKTCKLRIIHGGWTSANELEKNFVFYYLCDEDSYKTKQALNGLWTQVKRNTKEWIGTLPPERRSCFSETSKENIFLYNKKTLQFENQCKSSLVMDKELDKILQFGSSVLLISNKILQSECDGFKAELSSNPKSPSTFYFRFRRDTKYFMFDPDEYSGFDPRVLPPLFCAEDLISGSSLQDFKVSFSIVTQDNLTAENLQKDEHSSQCEPKESSKMTLESNMYTLECSDHEPSPTVDSVVSTDMGSQLQLQNGRVFQGSSEHILYHLGRIIAQPESDGTLQSRCTEFKLFATSLNKKKESPLIKLQKEVLRFACGCLNVRRNGTIYFGVADSVQPVEGRKYKHGEVVGFPISEIDNECRSRYTDSIRDGIVRCFSSEVINTAEKCIGNPVFVEVIPKGKGDPKFVMEVDVEASDCICRNLAFRLNLGKIKGIASKECPDKYKVYLRKGSATTSLSHDQELLFIRSELKEYVQERKRFEEVRKDQIQSLFLMEQPIDKLRKLMLKKRVKFDKSLWPILILGKPTDEQKRNKQWMDNISFIKRMQFVSIFDFDNMSNVDGLCKLYRNEETSILQSETFFLLNSSNIQQLASELGIPYEKTIWIFSNGRYDQSERKPHLHRQDWHMNYSAGVCHAVSFFSHNFVIPKGRALIIVLLFSTDFDGLLDTLNEITRNFGWGPVVIIAEQKSVYLSFAESIQRESKGTLEQMDSVSVSGMEWGHVNSAVCELTGYDEFTNCVVPSSSGAFISLDERTIESFADLAVLSSKQCESRKFRCAEERKDLANDHEIEFYKGGKVTWWNFFFNTHVLKRNGYEQIRDRLEKKLMCPKKDSRKILTVPIAHEPGAGGTTLGRNLLWEFRKKYRCAVIERVTERTPYHIKSFMRYRESVAEEVKPVLLLMDDLLHLEFSYEEFVRKLNIEFRELPTTDGLNCCILLCQREEKLPPYLSDCETLAVNLKQELVEYEKEWLEQKYLELEEMGKVLGLNYYQPEHLISFMVMREGFNQEFIKSTICHLINRIKMDSNEFLLLKYVALISAYTPSSRKGGVKVFVPIECCHDLMSQYHRKIGSACDWWEQYLSSTLRILLVIEQKESASGQQIRMAHASLANAVLDEIIVKEKSKLSTVVLEYLDSPLLSSKTHGRSFLVEFTSEMLKRRMKEEYDDDVTTSFSPLIENIIKEDGHQVAGQVLEKGFQSFKDHLIAQTMGRLYCKTKDHEKAVKWAKEAVDLSQRHSRSFCLQTLGFVLRETFKHQTENKRFSAKEAVGYLNLVLQSLDAFLGAQDREYSRDSCNILYPYHDTIVTINTITKFMSKSISYSTHFDIKRYLTEMDFIPEEVFDIWRDFHGRLKKMQKYGEAAFEVFQEYICFNATFYGDGLHYSSSRKNSEHRLYRNMNFQYPSLFDQFANVFGGNSDEFDPDSRIEMQDHWHRRRVLKLHGISHMFIFDHITRIRKPNEHFNKKDAVACFLEIKHHLSQIQTKSSKDLANLVSVNVALGLVGGPNRSSESEMVSLCQQIIATNKEMVHLAYFYISILMWPLEDMKVEYDDGLFHKAMRYLHEHSKKTTPTQRTQRHAFSLFKEEKNIHQPTTQFFLTKNTGIKSICHRFDIFFKEKPDSQFDNRFWGKPSIKEKLRRLDGHLVTRHDAVSVSIIMQNEKFGTPIEINKVRGGEKEFSEEPVSFYLGFSTAGPIAYNVKPKRHESESCSNFSYEERESSKIDEYVKKSTKELRACLREIKFLKTKSPNTLKVRQKQLLRDEDDIITALDVKEESERSEMSVFGDDY